MSLRNVPVTHEQRISKIFDKLHGLQSGAETQKQKRYEQTLSKIESLFEGLQQLQHRTQRDMAELKEDIIRVERTMESGGLMRDRPGKSAEVKRLQDRFGALLQDQIDLRKQNQTKLIRLIDQKFTNLSLAVAQQTKQRQGCTHQLRQSLASDLPRLASMLEQQSNDREQSDKEVMEEIAQGLTTATGEVRNMAEVREDSQADIYQMIKDVLARVTEELEIERSKRQSTEESILTLIQGICSKVPPSQR